LVFSNIRFFLKRDRKILNFFDDPLCLFHYFSNLLS
jgi:hypothetical protein